MKLNPKALGIAFAILGGIAWFIIMSCSLLFDRCPLHSTVRIFGPVHPFFYFSWWGMLITITEHLVGGFIIGWLFAWCYNKLVDKFTK